MSFVWILVGLVLLLGGGELVVRGASRLALSLGMTPMAVGLTVVAFATSAPELAASLTAASQGAPAVAAGNVLGSNIANIGLILGIAGVLHPIPVTAAFLRREVGVVIVASIALAAAMADGAVGRVEGVAFVAALVGYLGWMLRVESKKANEDVQQEFAEAVAPDEHGALWHLGVVAVGVALLVGGAQALVHGAVDLARAMAVPESVIGLTVVAVGTSLPELASSVIAARRGQGDIVLGNVIGSNIFNILGILGITALVQPLTFGVDTFLVDIGAMLVFAVLLLPILAAGMRLRRWEAAVLLVGYAAYIGWAFLGSAP